MPLVAYLDGERVDATLYGTESWAGLQASDARKRLTMPGCGIKAIAKARGATRFFSHASLDGCTEGHRGETEQHRALKTAVAAGINAVPEWHAVLEYRDPEGAWVIDVLASSGNGRRRVAFEVQLSSQASREYHQRSQNYFDSGMFPVWLVPKDLEHSPTRIPVACTGFGKSSPVPEDPRSLLGLEIRQDFVEGAPNLGAFIVRLLTHDPHWPAGSPAEQQELLDAARREREHRQAEDDSTSWLKRKIEEMNRNSAAPEKAFGAHTIHTEASPYIWATLTGCWRCGHPMLIWEATTPKGDHQYAKPPALKIKREVGAKRLENHAGVHRLVDQWLHETEADIGKAAIDYRNSEAKGEKYSAFACPSCNTTCGQFFVSAIHSEHWSLISAPRLRENGTSGPPAPKPPGEQPARSANRLRGGPHDRAAGRTRRPSAASPAQWAREIRESLDQGK